MKSVGKLAYLAYQMGMKDNVFTAASSMVYSTLMALVPGFTFVLTFFGAFGVLQTFVNQLARWFSEVFGNTAGVQLVSLLGTYTTNAMKLGVVGLISFLVTMVLLINKVWTLINRIFRTSMNRNVFKRVAGFVTFLIISVLLGAAYISMQGIMDTWYSKFLGLSVEGWARIVGMVVPRFLVFMMFFLLIYFVPNIKVKFSSAAIAALIGTVEVLVFNQILSSLTIMMANYSVIYGSFAVIFLFLLWMYAFWVIAFWCVEFAYVHQFRPDLQKYKGLPQSPALQLSEGVNITMLISSNFRNGQGQTSTREMIDRLAIPENRLYGFLDLLQHLRFITPTNNGRTEFTVARPLDSLKVQDLVKALYSLETISSDEHDTAGEAIAMQVKDHGIASLGTLTIENLLQRV
ncbi:MAG: YihY/virulence factor BrkB family protein [Sphaerochaetaceae bacterium]